MVDEEKHGLGKVMLAKVIVGVITTVAGAVIVYFIFNRDDDFRKRKEATLRAWNAYLESKSTLGAVMNKLGTTMMGQAGEMDENVDLKAQMERAKANVAREIDLTIRSFEHIKRDEGVDKRVFSIIDIKIEQARDMKAVMERVCDKLTALYARNLKDDEFQRQVAPLLSQAEKDLTEIPGRDSLRFDRLYGELCREYKETLPVKK